MTSLTTVILIVCLVEFANCGKSFDVGTLNITIFEAVQETKPLACEDGSRDTTEAKKLECSNNITGSGNLNDTKYETITCQKTLSFKETSNLRIGPQFTVKAREQMILENVEKKDSIGIEIESSSLSLARFQAKHSYEGNNITLSENETLDMNFTMKDKSELNSDGATIFESEVANMNLVLEGGSHLSTKYFEAHTGLRRLSLHIENANLSSHGNMSFTTNAGLLNVTLRRSSHLNSTGPVAFESNAGAIVLRMNADSQYSSNGVSFMNNAGTLKFEIDGNSQFVSHGPASFENNAGVTVFRMNADSQFSSNGVSFKSTFRSFMFEIDGNSQFVSHGPAKFEKGMGAGGFSFRMKGKSQFSSDDGISFKLGKERLVFSVDSGAKMLGSALEVEGGFMSGGVDIEIKGTVCIEGEMKIDIESFFVGFGPKKGKITIAKGARVFARRIHISTNVLQQFDEKPVEDPDLDCQAI